MTAPTPLNLGSAYERLRPPMLGELGALAREGVSVAPHDGLDLIHGFFLDEWPRTQASYEAAQGPLWAYRASCLSEVRPPLRASRDAPLPHSRRWGSARGARRGS